VHATLRQLSAALERNKVVEINPQPGSKFDPHQHQAISVVPADHAPNSVVAVLQKGYLIAERVLRPALVTVTAAAKEYPAVGLKSSRSSTTRTQANFRFRRSQHGKNHRH
jgi:hypothetical protein